jgi:exoribonuclease-2
MPKHVLFEEDGGLKAATVMSDAGTSLQVEHASGRRTKVKTAQVLLRFDAPDPGQLMPAAQAVAGEIDIDFLWECAPQDEFAFGELAGEYFGGNPSAVQATGVLMRLASAPVHFHRKGRGRFRPAPAETVRLALAALERRRQQDAAIAEMVEAMRESRLPAPIAAAGAGLLVRPDKQSLEWRALERACENLRRTPARLLLELGLFADAGALHLAVFEREHFPAGRGFPSVPAVPAVAESLPLSAAEAFSIDDSTTTEIDDCLSVQQQPDGRLRVGVHIAAPALAAPRDSPLDTLARERMSTVYMPGDKITMLPEAAIRPYSLDEGTERAVLSLYADLDDSGTMVLATESRVERIRVAANLRHDRLDEVVTEAALADPDARFPMADALRALWRLSQGLSAQRDIVRGRPEPRPRADFSFYVEDGRVRIVQRRRDAPLDRIVAEMMILANSRWGALLASHQVPGLYRSQQLGRVRMGTHPLPHQGLGVAQYLWSTSPLRRYVDLVNQRQLIAIAQADKPPYRANDADLFAILSAFEARHDAYGDIQTRMERFWCLRWLRQEGASRVAAVVIREDLVRLAEAPFVFRMSDLPALAPGQRIAIDILDTDELELSLSARFVEALAGTDEVPPAEDYPAEEGAGESVEGTDEAAVATAEAASVAASDAVAAASGDDVAGPGEPAAPAG